MNITKIKYFIDIVNFGSFSVAASHNFISQAAISQHITSMENELGFSLFYRSKGKVNLTAAGECFYEHAKNIYSDYNQAVRMAKQIQNENSGNIVIGIASLTRMDYMVPILQKFQQGYPNVEVKFEYLDFASLRSKLENGIIDMAFSIRYNLEEMKHIKIRHLAALKMGLLVSRQNPLSRYDSVTINDIKNEPIIMHTPAGSGGVYDHMIQVRKDEGFVPNITKNCNSAEVMKMMVSFNQGSVYLPEVITQYDYKTCKMLRIEDGNDYVDYCIAYHKSTRGSAIEVLVDRISDFFQSGFQEWCDFVRQEIGWHYDNVTKIEDMPISPTDAAEK